MENQTKNFTVFNRSGELIFNAPSKKEVEAFLGNLAKSKGLAFLGESDAVEASDVDSRGIGSLIVKGLMAIKNAHWTVKSAMFYQGSQWVQGEAGFIDILDTLVPIKVLMEMAAKGCFILFYCFGGTNPYPPHSYQYHQWVRTNTYYVEG